MGMNVEEQRDVPWDKDPHICIFNDEIPGKVRMHTKHLDMQDWVRIDNTYVDQMRVKSRLLETQLQDVFVSSHDDGTTLAKWELFELLCKHLPERFEYIFERKPGFIYNKVTGAMISISSSNPEDPLIRCAKLTQEDWVLMKWNSDIGEYVLAAGCVCFPMRWVLKEKLHHSITQLHAPVKGFLKHLRTKVNSLLRKMQPDKPITRGNWVVLNDLESPMHLYTPVNPKKIGEVSVYKGEKTGRELIFRSEYQTLRKLARTQYVVFSLRTYQRYLEEFNNFSDQDCQGLIEAIETIDPDFHEYKAVELWGDATVKYLRNILMQRGQKARNWFPRAAFLGAGVTLAILLLFRLNAIHR